MQVMNTKGRRKNLTEKERSIFLKQLNDKGMIGVLRKNTGDDVPLTGREL
jgi:hypothetical protein